MVTPEEALKVALALTSVNEPDAVKVCSISVLFVPVVCDFVVASALCKPFTAISPVREVSVAAGVIVDSVDAMKPAPLSVADVSVRDT